LSAAPAERFVSELANIFREARESAGLSQNALAAKSGVGRTGIITFEQGDRIPSALILHKLAVGIGTPLSELVAAAEARTGLGPSKAKQ
jgi:transcriptional regulator with XRE-family HTH domain